MGIMTKFFNNTREPKGFPGKMTVAGMNGGYVALAGEYEMKPMPGTRTYVVSILPTFGVSLPVGQMAARKNEKSIW